MGDQVMADESILGLLLRAHAEAAAQSHGERYVFDNLSSSAHEVCARIPSALADGGIASSFRRLDNYIVT